MADDNGASGFRNDWLTKDFYKVLGVGKEASADDIKKAYRKLARANHPDSNPGDTAKHDRFKQVAEAYDVVGDAEKRKKYDEMRALGPAMAGGRGGFGPGGARLRHQRPAARPGGRRVRRHVRRPVRRGRAAAAAARHRGPPAAATSRRARRSRSPTR